MSILDPSRDVEFAGVSHVVSAEQGPGYAEQDLDTEF